MALNVFDVTNHTMLFHLLLQEFMQRKKGKIIKQQIFVINQMYFPRRIVEYNVHS